MPQRYTINGFCRGFEGKFSQETKKKVCLFEVNPRSFLSNFWGLLHFDTPSLKYSL